MIRKAPVLLPLAFVAIAACDDTVTAPAPLAPDALPAFDGHVWQAGNGSAWHGYTAPAVVHWVDGNDVTLCATWTDEDGPDTDFYSFDARYLLDGDVEWSDERSARGDADGADACLTFEDLEDGKYTFSVVGMARAGTGQTTTTHHTDAWEGEVQVGGLVWTAHLVAASASGRISDNAVVGLQKNANQWKVTFSLRLNDDDVLSCGDPVTDVEVDATYDAPSNGNDATVSTSLEAGSVSCDDTTGLALFDTMLSNQSRVNGSGQPDWSGTLAIAVNGSDVANSPTTFSTN